MANWIISAFADECASSVEGQISALHLNGIDHIELRFIDGKNIADLTKNEVVELKKQLDAGGITASAIGSPIGKISLADNFEEHLEKARRVFDTACVLGTDKIRMFSFYLREGKTREECRSEVFFKLGRLIDLAEGFGVKLCHENEAKIYGESPQYCLDIFKHFGGKMRAVFDMGNFVLDGHDPIDAYAVLKDYIEYFHIKDATKNGAIVPAGCGDAKIRQLLHTYREEFGKDVLLSLEPHLQVFDGLDSLVGKAFDTPYTFKTKEEAFKVAADKTKELL